MKTLNDVINHKGVKSISDERSKGDGIFVYLTKDYRDFDFDPYCLTGTIHEQTIKEIIKRFDGVRIIK